MKINKHIPANNTHKQNKYQKIPYNIVQTMKKSDIPKDMYNAAMSWVKNNPEYNYYFFDDKECIKFIKKNYSETVLHCFNMLNSGSAKADLFRWLFLYKKGGIYADIDTVCKYPISKFINSECDLFIRDNKKIKIKEYYINHNIIASTKNNKILKNSINMAINKILSSYRKKNNVQLPQDICEPGI